MLKLFEYPFCLDVPMLRLFECLPQNDFEYRINGGLRPPAFSTFASVLHLQILTKALEKFKVKASERVYQVWERNPLSFLLYTQAVFKQKLHYIHANHVVGGGFVHFLERTNILTQPFTRREVVNGTS